MDEPVSILWTALWTALGLAIAMEGILYSLFPDAMKRMMAQVIALPSGTIRGVGIGAAFAGVFILWLVLG
ncbi:MAG: DUF2065 domain-containing protein [Rhodospirillales bacterium]|nr:DUF2065 domain-containing protein [Rhodospirillales bacterium]